MSVPGLIGGSLLILAVFALPPLGALWLLNRSAWFRRIKRDKPAHEETRRSVASKEDGNYGMWAFLTGGIVFIGTWIYAISEWGLLLGLMFGWLPALIGGFIAGVLWPIIAIILAVSLYLILREV